MQRYLSRIPVRKRSLRSTFFLSSPSINYQLGGTNQLTFNGLAAGEKQTVQPTYAVGETDIPSSNALTSQILITQDHTTTTVSRTFTIGRRLHPLRQIWLPASSLLAA